MRVVEAIRVGVVTVVPDMPMARLTLGEVVVQQRADRRQQNHRQQDQTYEVGNADSHPK